MPAAADTADSRRLDRGAWLTLAFVVVFALCAATVSAITLRQPSDGCVVLDAGGTSHIIAECYGDWPTTLRPGDELIAAEGAQLSFNLGNDSLFGQPPPPTWVAGGTITYTVRRDGLELTLPVPIRQLSWRGVGRVFAYTAWYGNRAADALGQYIFYLSVLVIFALAPGNIAARLLLVNAGAHFAVTKLGWQGASIPSIDVTTPGALLRVKFAIASFWVWLFWPSLLLLMLSFPRRVWPVARWPRAAPALIYGLPIAVVAFTLASGALALYIATLFSQFALLLVALIAVPTHTFRRVRDPVVRAQTGWMILGLACFIVPVVIAYPLILAFPQLIATSDGGGFAVTDLLSVISAVGLPLCLGIAITRYRLFDIGVVIRRTLVYAVLTLALGAVYFGGVTLLQALFVRLTGQESTLAVVASTLAIAALFLPLRRRVQQFIDRRFFRRKYDARLVLAQFAERAQQEAEVDALAADILGTVQEALEPEGVRLWLTQTRQSSSVIPEKST